MIEENKQPESFKTPKIVNNQSHNHLKYPSNNNASQPSGQPANDRAPKNDQQESQQSKEQMKEEELRNTWRRGPPKINYHKLPSAFGNVLSNPNKKNKNQLIGPGNQNAQSANQNQQQFNLANNGNVVKNIEEIVDIEEYKKVQNMLSPLKNEVKMQKPASDQNQQEEKQQKQRKHKSSSNKNPLLPLKNYMINYSKASEEINEVPEFAIEKFSKYISKGYKPGNELSQSILQIGSMLKLEEMITLGIMKGSRENSVVKKVLHAPTLQLYTVKEEPIHNKDVRKNLKEWIYFWQNNLNQSEQHIKIYNIFWNSPEGCASILMEYAVGGSLQNLLESLGTIPEKSIRQLAIEVLFALRKFHNEFNIPHGALSPSQILFTKEGNIKLSCGISQKSLAQNSVLSSVQLGKASDKLSLYDPLPLYTPNIQSNNANLNAEKGANKDQFEKSKDIFQFGLILLVSSLGFTDLMDNSQQLFSNIKNVLDDINSPSSQHTLDKANICCLIHSENIISQPSAEITINSLIAQQHFSAEYVDFLCKCLQLSAKKRATIDTLLLHPFLTKKKIQLYGAKVYMPELIQISIGWTRQEMLPVDCQGASEKLLERIAGALNVVLPNCDKWFVDQNFTNYTKLLYHLSKDSPIIQTLALDLGINAQKVFDKIFSVFQQQSSFAAQQKKQMKV